MNEDWQAFLLAQGANLRNGIVTDFGRSEDELRALEAQTVLCDLSHLGLLGVEGEDAEGFLQGQLTNDVRHVNDSRCQLSSHCSPRGRMLATFRLLLRERRYLLEMRREILEPIRKRLCLFVLRSRVRIDDLSDALVRVGIAGPEAAELVGQSIGAVPREVDSVHQEGAVTVLRLPSTVPRFEVLGDPDAMQTPWNRLAARCVRVGTDPWALLDIRAGIPTVSAATADVFVPQMANLQLVDGVSFRKGCYTGQEVVARSQYLGRLKRRMYRATVLTDQRPAAGDSVFSPGAETDQAVGKVVDARPAPEGGYELLAVLQIESAENGRLHLGAVNGPGLELRELPYPFGEDSPTSETKS
jgi:folate-binding protein YgfZ